MAKNIMNGGYLDFIDKYFPIEFPELRRKFPAQIEWSFISKDLTGVKKPVDMSQDDFDEFRRIEHEWLLENGFIDKYEDNPSFVNRVGGVTWIPLQFVEIESVLPLENNFATINLLSLKDNTPHSYCVVGSMDYINKKLRIV